MNRVFLHYNYSCIGTGIILLSLAVNVLRANPTGGTVTQGSATFSSSGSQFNINQASANALINWQSFNIGVGETVNFNQPSSTSVAWNQINDPNPSQILGSLNANGYVILQNSSGFVVGGQAAITAHGLIMTTAATPALNLSSGGPWSFNTPPPTAKIVNYGTINIAGGGSAYLIANDIENNGTISAPGGKIGLYAGQTVLVSTSPDGRGLSAQATIPQGLVDNNGNLVADGGSIALRAQMVNQNGLIQANSAQNVNGTIELVGSDSVNLGADSIISAHGDSQGTSSGGSVMIKSDNSFSDQAGSTINIAGGAQGGNGGQVGISAPQMSAINSSINSLASAGYADASLSIDTADISLNSDGSPVAGALSLNLNALSSGYSQIKLQAADSITLSSQWNLTPEAGIPGTISLLAGNNITVDNGSGIEVDGGRITLTAKSISQNGTLQADTINGVPGFIEIDATDNLNLGANSIISANGDSTAAGASPAGFVVLNSGNTYADTPTSVVNVSGQKGGRNGIVEIYEVGAGAGPVQSSIGNTYALLINPYDITISSSTTDTSSSSPTFNVGDFSIYSEIALFASDNITLNTGWTLAAPRAPSVLTLSAGNNIILTDGSAIVAPNNWTLNLFAGASVPAGAKPTHISDGTESDGIYLNGNAYIQAVNGDVNNPILNTINLDAANEIVVNGGAIRTIGGGNINVTAEYGNVNSGSSVNGFNYLAKAPYYTPFLVSSSGIINYNQCNLGGISTAAGGNVTINAGGDVISSPTTTVAAGDPGTGAFGPEAGNVTINAGGNVYGNYIVMNGVGTINAGQNIGTAVQNAALSLAKGSWNLNAQNDIFLQEVRNPNGVFNNTPVSKLNSSPSAGNHLFDYDPQASVELTAGDGVYLTGNELPRPFGGTDPSRSPGAPMLLPPIVMINAGPGGVNLQQPTATDGSGTDVTLRNLDITLFPSPYQNLEITTTDGGSLNGNGAVLFMSDSGRTQWLNTSLGNYSGPEPFGEGDHASGVPWLLNNDEPATINLAGSMLNLILITDKATDINIAGDMDNCSFYGENLQATGPASITSITVGGQIYNAGSFTSVTLDQPLPALPAADTPLTAPTGASLSSWFLPLLLALDPANTQSILFPGLDVSALAYNPNTKTLTAIGPMSAALLDVLETQTLTVPRYNSFGIAVGTDTINWIPSGSANASLISSLYTSSQSASPESGLNKGAPPAYVVGGTGQFNVTAGSIALGNSGGFLSVFDEGGANLTAHGSYSYLAPYVTSGATINVTVLDPQQTVNGLPEPSLYMPASTIASLGGGDVNVSAPNGAMDLGSQELLPFENEIMNASKIGLGIYTTAGGNVTVTALGTINIDSSRIATFDGGNIFIESYTGDVNAGSGGTVAIPINYFSPSYSLAPLEFIPANGIVAGTLTAATTIPPGAATLPGNITVITPQGSINADLGGISQAAFGEILTAATATSTIGLFAGTPLDFNGDWSSEANNWLAKPPLYIGNIELGVSGVIGINVTTKATGDINGKIIAQGNASVEGQGFGELLVVAGGHADVAGGGGNTGPITIVAMQGVNASGVGPANILSTSVNGGAGTLATASSASSASQSATAQTSTENQQQVANKDSGNDDDKDKKKKGALARSAGRVTVILHKAG